METQTESLKELLIANMPAYPVKRSYLVSIYGQGVVGALNDLMAENKVLRAKRGYYILSDEMLDNYKDVEPYVGDVHEDLGYDLWEFMPTQVIRTILSSWVSQFSLKVLIEQGLTEILTEIDYYTTSTVGTKDAQFGYLLEELITNLSCYRLTDEGVRLRNLVMSGI